MAHDHSTHDHGTHSHGPMASTMMPMMTTMNAHAGHGSMDMMSGGMMMANGCGMNMLFHFGITECVLFSQWKITTTAEFILSWFGLFFMVFIRELLVLIQRWPRILRAIASAFGAEQDPASNKFLDVEPNSNADWALTMWDAFWYTMNVTLGYILMLVFMTYNVGLCSAVVAGFFFSRAFLQRKVGDLTRLKNKQRGSVNHDMAQALMTMDDADDCCNVPPAAANLSYDITDAFDDEGEDATETTKLTTTVEETAAEKNENEGTTSVELQSRASNSGSGSGSGSGTGSSENN